MFTSKIKEEQFKDKHSGDADLLRLFSSIGEGPIKQNANVTAKFSRDRKEMIVKVDGAWLNDITAEDVLGFLKKNEIIKSPRAWALKSCSDTSRELCVKAVYSTLKFKKI